MTRTEQTAPDGDAPGAEAPTPRRGLPVGPFGLLVITAIALAAAGLVLWVGTRDDDSGAVRVEKALEGVEGASVVPDGTDPAGVGDTAPDVQLALLDGATTRLSAFGGRPVVLNFWSSTCAPCLKEMPDLQQVWSDNGGDVAVVGVDVTDTEAAGREMVAQTGVTYPNGRDPRAEIFAAFGGTALPRTVFIDADGTIAEVHNGALTADEVEATLRDHGLLD
ncbi:TlpA family protein disulfide reductase [Dermatobacter hominis]|uniref:TlpA family protein disulfide reductase n=1 Tax=Dermatobacter hominis TaxID=2884263 RepID=UPI001D10D339|nr:TlpA disulfide reductase family protein [Dermatobacter hominis]UDY34058.1 TlpA family protein disulfide reductase [Dermatobacter hominis]